jgi:hypothetical protein
MNDYETRVRKLEAEGLTRSDAQGVVDAQDLHPELWEPKEIDNDDRANFVQDALNRYQQARLATESGDDLETIVIDFLTDLMHLADRDGLDLPNLQRIATDHYLEEKE